jgi:hypothetical protein
MAGADCSATMSDSGDSDAETSRVQQVPGVDSKLEIDKIILPSLRPHQVEGVNFMLSCMSRSPADISSTLKQLQALDQSKASVYKKSMIASKCLGATSTSFTIRVFDSWNEPSNVVFNTRERSTMKPWAGTRLSNVVTKAGNMAGARLATGSFEAVPPIFASVVGEAEHARVCAALVVSEKAKEKMALLIKSIEIEVAWERKRISQYEGMLTNTGRSPSHWPL